MAETPNNWELLQKWKSFKEDVLQALKNSHISPEEKKILSDSYLKELKDRKSQARKDWRELNLEIRKLFQREIWVDDDWAMWDKTLSKLWETTQDETKPVNIEKQEKAWNEIIQEEVWDQTESWKQALVPNWENTPKGIVYTIDNLGLVTNERLTTDKLTNAIINEISSFSQHSKMEWFIHSLIKPWININISREAFSDIVNQFRILLFSLNDNITPTIYHLKAREVIPPQSGSINFFDANSNNIIVKSFRESILKINEKYFKNQISPFNIY